MTARAVSGAVPDTPASAPCTCGYTGCRVRPGRLGRPAAVRTRANARWRSPVIMLSTAGVALLVARGFAAGPALVTAALGAGTVICSAMLGSGWLRQHRALISEPGANRALHEAAAAGAGGRT